MGGTILISLLLAAVVECYVSLLMRLLRRSAKVEPPAHHRHRMMRGQRRSGIFPGGV
ncbi:MAG: hypothetical protein V8S77_10465 [Oscillospiraceae bacterium]